MFNKWIVGLLADDIVILNPPRRLTKAEAVEFACWLAIMADPEGKEFDRVRKEMEG
jgi:hypothetical protein